MTVYGGYQPGTYQAWALNLQQSTFGTAGIARGMQVTPTSPPGMSVLVAVDPTHGDGVCYIANGGWVRIDAALTLSVPSNSSGSTRNDAVVATMDPTGATSVSIQYIQNWAGGFAGASNNQLVLALVSVPTGASSIASGNITQQTQAASFGNASTAGTANTVGPIGTSNGAYIPQVQTSTSGFGLGVIDNTAGGFVEVFPVALSGTARNLVLGWTDTSNVLHPGVGVGTNALNLDPISVHGETANSVYIKAVNPGVGGTNVDLYVNNPTSGWVYLSMQSGTAHFDSNAGFAANVVGDSGGSIFLKTNTVGMRLFAANTTAGIAFQKYDLFVLLPFA